MLNGEPMPLAETAQRHPRAPLFLAAAMLAATATHASDALQRFEYEHVQMGTWFRLVIYAPAADRADAAATAAFARIDALNASLSDYIPSSEVTLLTAPENVGSEVPLGEDLHWVLTHAMPIQEHSRGALDLTTGPLTHLWRRARESGTPPDPDSIRAALRTTGYEKLRFHASHATATPTVPGMRLDLGAVAKGYAADRALAECRALGLTRVLVAAGGDVVAGDPPPGQPGWRIGLPPASASGPPEQCLILSHGAISTSSDENQHLTHGGKRLSHIIDPRTGDAVTHGCTVTVAVSHTPSNGLMADALATAVNVLGPEHGPELLRRFGTAGARIIRPGPAGPTIQTTPAFQKWRVVPREACPAAQTGSGMVQGSR